MTFGSNDDIIHRQANNLPPMIIEMTMPLTFFNNDNNTTITLLRGETVELEDGTRVEIKAMDSMGTIWFTLDDEDLLQCVDFKTIKKVA